MKIKNWQHAEQIISSGAKILEKILSEYSDEDGCGLLGSQINGQLQCYLIFEEKYFRTKFLPLTLEITKDMKQAKEYLWLNAQFETKVQEINK